MTVAQKRQHPLAAEKTQIPIVLISDRPGPRPPDIFIYNTCHLHTTTFIYYSSILSLPLSQNIICSIMSHHNIPDYPPPTPIPYPNIYTPIPMPHSIYISSSSSSSPNWKSVVAYWHTSRTQEHCLNTPRHSQSIQNWSACNLL